MPLAEYCRVGQAGEGGGALMADVMTLCEQRRAADVSSILL